MTRAALLLLLLGAASPLAAEDAPAVYQKESPFAFKFDLQLRQEWTDTEYVRFQSGDRRFARLRPELDWRIPHLTLGVGGDFIYSSDDNTEPPPGAARLPVQRDNYRSRDARLDLAFARWEPASWVRLEGGRFEMPVPVTEMIWDRDLRAQGAALTLKHQTTGPVRRLKFTAVGTQGGHVFDDGQTRMLILAGTLGFGELGGTSGELTGAWIGWDKLAEMTPELRRQNTVVGSAYEWPFHVVDLVGRLRAEPRIPLELVAEVCRNTAAPDQRDGIWLAAILGKERATRVSLEYTYAWIDRNATLGAYAADDFLWTTGWEGHRLDGGVKLHHRVSLHAIGYTLRFKDSPSAATRDEWVNRARIELRAR